MNCHECGKKLRRIMNEMHRILLEGESVTVCYKCFVKLMEEYDSKKTCKNCYYFDNGFCKKIDLELTRTELESKTYFPQAEDCVYFITKKDYEKKLLRGEPSEGKEKQTKDIGIVRERVVIVKTRCPYCGRLYDETLDVCPHCGGKR
jgi:hypothetical protein